MSPMEPDVWRAFFGNPSEESFVPIYERTHRLVYSICHRILRNPEDTADAFQSVYCRLLALAHDPQKGPELEDYGAIRATTGQAGRYQLDNIPPIWLRDAPDHFAYGGEGVKYRIRCRAKGYAPTEIEVLAYTENIVDACYRFLEDYTDLVAKSIAPKTTYMEATYPDVVLPKSYGNVLTDVDIVMTKEAAVMGRVLDTRGNALGEGSIRMDSTATSSALPIEDRWQSPKEEGCYEIAGLEEGEYLVRFSADYRGPKDAPPSIVFLIKRVPVRVRAGSDTRLDIDFSGSAGIYGKFTSPDEKNPWCVYVLDPRLDASLPKRDRLCASTWGVARYTIYKIEGLSPGTYTVLGGCYERGSMSPVDNMETSTTITLEAGQLEQIDFEFP